MTDEPKKCRLCGGEIGPSDTASRGRMCYGCGPPDVIPADRPEKKQREHEPRWGGEFP